MATTHVDPLRSAIARKNSGKSPWRHGPHADTGKAKASFIQYAKRGKLAKEQKA